MGRGRVGRRVLAAKIGSGRGAKKEKGDHYKKQGMDYQTGYLVVETEVIVEAEVNVVSEPGGGQPTSPVFAKEHADSANDRKEPDDENPKYVVFIRVG